MLDMLKNSEKKEQHCDIIKKEMEIIARIQEGNFDLFDGDKEEVIKTIGSQMNYFPKYVNAVIDQQIQTPIIYATKEGQDLRDAIQDLDSYRRSVHEAAIGACNILNRICDRLGLEPFTTIDTTDRYAVADFAGKFTSQVFADGTATTMDEAAYNEPAPYQGNAYDHLKQLEERMNKKEAETATPETNAPDVAD